jgi:para-nitrobenzyl esterase
MTAPAPDRDPPPIVRAPCGPVAGTRHGGTEVFLGVPYATARRFAPPTPLEPWDRPFDATRHRAQSPQIAGALERLLGDPDVPTAEACHHLEIYTPACDHGRRPVLVWIHGGAFVTGGASMPWYHGASLCELGDVVVVTINYRLGALGFTADTNLGLRDQVAALEWVAANIAAFGGDPSNVTVFGESAGGASVVALLAVPSARDLFVRAWAMSPSLPQLRSRRRAQEATAQLLEAAGVDHLDEFAELELDLLLAAQGTVLADLMGAITAFAPTVDGDFLPAHPLDAAATDPRPLVLGTTRDEMHLFNAFDPANAAIDDTTLHQRFGRVFGRHATEAVRRYRLDRPGSTAGQLVSAMQTDETFRMPARRLASRRADADADAPTWMYWFTFATPVFGGLLGSCHGLDIPFAFHNLDRPGVPMFTGDDPERIVVADEFAGALLAYARGGDPGWTSYDTGSRATRIVDVHSDTIDDPEPQLRVLWDDRHGSPD